MALFSGVVERCRDADVEEDSACSSGREGEAEREFNEFKPGLEDVGHTGREGEHQEDPDILRVAYNILKPLVWLFA